MLTQQFAPLLELTASCKCAGNSHCAQEEEDGGPPWYILLNLPAELHNRIYSCSFAACDAILIRRTDTEEDGDTSSWLKGERVLQDPEDGKDAVTELCLKQHGNVNLLRVCKQIYGEAEPVL